MIGQLFEEGKVVQDLYPMRLIYLPCDREVISHHQVLFSVPKKKIKHAVDRNVIKRKMREAYRLTKYLLTTSSNSPFYFLLAFVYISSDLTPTFDVIQKQVNKGVQQLNKMLAGLPSNRPSIDLFQNRRL